jgi:hypothetical protein
MPELVGCCWSMRAAACVAMKIQNGAVHGVGDAQRKPENIAVVGADVLRRAWQWCKRAYRDG